MYRVVLFLLILTRCQSPVLLPPLYHYLVNPYSHIQKPDATGRFLDSLKPSINSTGQYRLTRAWLRAKIVEKTIEEQYDSTRYSETLALALKRDTVQREMLAARIQLTEVLNYQNSYDSVLHYAHDDFFIVKKIDKATPCLIRLLLFASLDSAYNSFGTEIDASILILEKDLDTKYKAREKDNEINSLASGNEVNWKSVRRQRLILFIIVAVMLLSGIAVSIIWRREWLRMQLQEIELRQQLLRARMEPHFIFNSLHVLQSLMRTKQMCKLTQYVTQFSKLLRVSLQNAGYNYVPLHEELAALNSYLMLQAINHEGLFDYTIEAYEGYEKDFVLIPPMLLQPFVENSIIHGFRSIKHKGWIRISIKKGSRILYVTIEDNGSGLQDNPQHRSKRPLSTSITQDRLNILSKRFNKSATLTIIDKQRISDEQGLKVVLLIPFAYYEV